ncbi:MAG: cardiolipin synthase [Desulfobacterales bacterium]|nr:cardiolipin synthase [Desulfobacterales bacterium]
MTVLQWVILIFSTLVSIFAAGHALISKRDSRASMGWIAVCLMFPLFGPLLYFLFGINRIQTKAKKLHRRVTACQTGTDEKDASRQLTAIESLPGPAHLYQGLVRISDRITLRPLTPGNRIETLCNGEAAYPAMLEAIENAQRRVLLASYIFDNDSTGKSFVEALQRATARGVEVRVLVDGFGELYSFPSIFRQLRKKKITAARFIPPRLIPPALDINLRNHRKLLIADGRTGFTGGMNISDRHLVHCQSRGRCIQDMHFRITGPAAFQMEQIFIEDWLFASGEALSQTAYQPFSEGDAFCRTIIDGPDEDLDKLIAILVGAVSAARKSVRIMTPYFLPPRPLIAALQSAALRGVDVTVILPEKSNLPFVQWATENMLWEPLQRGVRICYQPPPFAHSKLFIVDDIYSQIGSANIDPRSLRLNFEIAVEVYDHSFSGVLTRHFDAVRHRSREIRFEDVESRTLPIRIRDSLAWLFTPYL